MCFPLDLIPCFSPENGRTSASLPCNFHEQLVDTRDVVPQDTGIVIQGSAAIRSASPSQWFDQFWVNSCQFSTPP